VAKKNRRQKVFLFFIFFQPICKFSGRSDNLLAAGAKGAKKVEGPSKSQDFVQGTILNPSNGPI
jgi:hypothetical protein